MNTPLLDGIEKVASMGTLISGITGAVHGTQGKDYSKSLAAGGIIGGSLKLPAATAQLFSAGPMKKRLGGALLSILGGGVGGGLASTLGHVAGSSTRG